jgi:alginate O-acetyltransferase complex protein AlgI
MPDLHQIALFFQELIIWQTPKALCLYVVCLFGTPVIVYHALGWIGEHLPAWKSSLKSSYLEGILCALMLYLIATNAGAPQGFIYFQF